MRLKFCIFLAFVIGLAMVSETMSKTSIGKDGKSERKEGREGRRGKSAKGKVSKRTMTDDDDAAPPPAAPADTGDENADPDPDPFSKNPKWSNFVHRVDAISASLKTATQALSGLLSSPPSEGLLPFAKEFAKHFVALNDFFRPLHEELTDNAAYTVVNPAVGLTDLKKLHEWARSPPSGKLDQARLKWIEVNGYAITVHYIFDRLYPEIEKWGLTEAEDSAITGYPTWLQTISGYEGGDKPTYELRQLEHLIADIDKEIDAEGEKGHMMRSLEKILRKHLAGWDPDSDYNIYCFGNNEFGIIHDVYDLLTDAAMYLSMADMKQSVLNATRLVLKEWEAQTGGGEEGDPTKAASPTDLSGKFEEIFTNMKTRIDRKIRIAELIESPDQIIPGPTTFKCDRSPGDDGTKEPTPTQPPGHDPLPPKRALTNAKPPVFPVSQWGKPPPEPMSPRQDSEPDPRLDSQSGPEHPLPVGYIDKRPASFEWAAFSKAYMGYLEAETVLNPDGSCKSTCPDFKRPTATCENKTLDCEANRNAYCEAGVNCMEKSQCKRTARKCMRTAHKVSFCPSQRKTRLYEWIEINGTLIGKETDDIPDTCDSGVMKATERWEMDFGVILNAPQYCELCLCVCDSPMSEDGVHFVDLQAVEAQDGFVITSLKFVQKDNVLRLDAEQGKLLDNGNVDQSTLVWIESPPPDINDMEKSAELGGSKENAFRKFGLDMIYGNTKEVITGIKFIRKGDIIHLSAKLSTVSLSGSFEGGGASDWKSRNFPEPPSVTGRVDLEDRVGSLKQKGPSQPREKPQNSKVVQFDASSLTLDAGQSVIPMFDIQPSRHHTVRKALNAVGLLYKTKKGYGGFLSPTVTPWRKFFL